MKSVDFNEIYKEHAEMIFRFLLRMCNDEHLAEDLMQDTFLKAIEKINTFDMRCKLSTWLCQIAKNTYYDYLRKQHKNIEIGLDEMADMQMSAVKNIETPEDEIVVAETLEEIHHMIHRLSEPYKEVFLLRYFAELSYKEIGRIFGKSEVWGRVTYLRSKEMLISMLRGT